MIVTASGLSRMRAFLLLRYLLIIGASYLILVENRFSIPPVGTSLIIVAALTSNVVASLLQPALIEKPSFTAAVIIGDLAWTTGALVLSGHFTGDFFYVYFFVLLLAAIGDNLQLIAIGAVIVCGAYGYVLAMDGTWSLWQSPSVIRLPFLFIASAFYGYLVDVNRADRRRADAADTSARDKLEAVAGVSHDIRTSVCGILGWTELLLGTTLDPVQREYAQGAYRASDALRGLISDLLDVSKAEAGKLELDAADFDVREVIDEVIEMFARQAASKGLLLDQRVDAPGIVHGDGPRLRRIVTNLVGNAIKFTDRGSVSIKAAVVDRTNSDLLMRFEVCDTGTGLAAEEQARLFQPFVQARQSTARRYGGTGLGLAISKKLVTLMHGEIGVVSSAGTGSTFWFTARFGTAVGDARLVGSAVANARDGKCPTAGIASDAERSPTATAGS